MTTTSIFNIRANFVEPETLPAFSFQTESDSYDGRLVDPISNHRKKAFDKFIARGKDNGWWSKITAMWVLVHDVEGNIVFNLKSTGFTMSKVGAPTFLPNGGVTGTSTAYWDTGFNPSAQGVDPANFHVSIFNNVGSLQTAQAIQALDGSSNGISLGAGLANRALTFRANGPLKTTAVTGRCTGAGSYIVSQSGTSAKSYANGRLIESTANSVNTVVNTNLRVGISTHELSVVSIGTALTDDDMAADFAAATRYLVNCLLYGCLDFHLPGYAPALVNVDFVVYGATAQGCLWAVEAARRGKSVAIVGGWRERFVGGMSSSGLGRVDLNQSSSWGGLGRYILTLMNDEDGVSDTVHNWDSRKFEQHLRALLDADRTGTATIPVYWSTGIESAQVSSNKLISFTTEDGRTFRADQFADATYEGDLLAKAGCSYIVGREAAGSGAEASNGYHFNAFTYGNNNQFPVAVDPYVTPGNPASGLIHYVNPKPALAEGVADDKVQAYNFRLVTTSSATRIKPISNVAPAGYDKSRLEIQLRWFAAMEAAGQGFGVGYSWSGGVTDIWLRIVVSGSNVYDLNNGNGLSSDLRGESWEYPEASYAEREAIWAIHRQHIEDLLYTYCYGRTNEGDTRIVSALETAARADGYDLVNFLDPYPGDPLYWPYQLYVREARRLIGDYVHTGNDLIGTDGTTPRSTHTIGTASYEIDSHGTEFIEDAANGTVRFSGGLADSRACGADGIAPIPFECAVPKRDEVQNLSVLFCFSATHIAFSTMRMEPTAMQVGQSMAIAQCIAHDQDIALQDVDYAADLRPALLDDTLWFSGEIALVLPQIN